MINTYQREKRVCLIVKKKKNNNVVPTWHAAVCSWAFIYNV